MRQRGHLYQPAEILVFGEKNPVFVLRKAHHHLISRSWRQFADAGYIVTRRTHCTHKTKVETLVGQEFIRGYRMNAAAG